MFVHHTKHLVDILPEGPSGSESTGTFKNMVKKLKNKKESRSQQAFLAPFQK